ncbi:MAG: FtsX-like permease family protein [Gemmatimonadetes bacterium]|nr:FtsX-like permease family protein [Gemmatimonadota bacterium]
MLARAVSREREFAIRGALGASRGRAIRQLLTESVFFALIGGAAALLLAEWGIRVIRSLSPPSLPRLEEIGIDHRVIAFALLVSLGTAVLFGLVPALQLARSDLQQRLRSGGHAATARPGARRFRSALVVSELALAMVLLIGAGLLVRSFVALLQVKRGYRTDNVLAVTVQAWQYHPSPAQRAAFVQQTVERLGYLPGVHSAGVTSSLPLAAAIGAQEVRGLAVAPAYFRIEEGLVRGVNVSAYNDVRGTQQGLVIGIFNYARELDGLQVGVLNYAANKPPRSRLLPLLNYARRSQ